MTLFHWKRITQKYIHKHLSEIIITHFHGCFPPFGSASETYWREDRCRIQKPMKGWMITSPSCALGIVHLFAVTYSFYRSVCSSVSLLPSQSFPVLLFLFMLLTRNKVFTNFCHHFCLFPKVIHYSLNPCLLVRTLF